MNEKILYIYGKHAVREAADTSPAAVRVAYLADTVDAPLRAAVKQAGITIDTLDPRKLPGDVPKDAVHQGCIAAVEIGKLMQPYDAFMAALSVTDDTGLIMLGEIQDPHNVGAIIRSAAAFGIAGVLMPEHRQAPITGAVIKASAGMAFKIPLVTVGNVNTTIRDLKKRGFWVYGLEGAAKQSVAEEGFEKASVFILGNEGAGIRQKTLEHCDVPLLIPMAPGVESLNASVAAAIVCYAWSGKHPKALHR